MLDLADHIGQQVGGLDFRHEPPATEPVGFAHDLVELAPLDPLRREHRHLADDQRQFRIVVGAEGEAHLAAHHTDKSERTALIERFLKPAEPLSILIVCDMLLTGFDAPIEQVMYLDSPLKEHTLLQAIARVNRVYDEVKTYGLVVDYWGVSEALEEALSIFSPSDVQGAMKPKTDELPRLETRHQAALRFFVRVKQKDDLNECVAVLGAEDVRAEFDQAFKRFAQSLDMLLPDPRAVRFVGDFKWLGKIRQAAAARYRDKALDISDCGPKVRKLIEEAIVAEGIQILVKQVNLFTPEFEQKLAALKSDEARASEMEHAIRDEIHIKLDEDPVLGSTRPLCPPNGGRYRVEVRMISGHGEYGVQVLGTP